MLRINDLCKSFEGKEVIKSLSLSFPKSGFVAICGPSGCGKSTLLHIIAGIESSDRGEILFDTKHPKISMSFQEPRLLTERTAVENVNLVLGDKKATLPRAKELLLMLDIEESDLYPDELSGGMKARVSIARALAKRSDIYIFDEPFANLDKETALLCIDTIKKEADGALVIAVMHDTELAEKISDRVIDL